MPIHISITHAFAGVLSAKLFNLRFVSQHQISGRAVKSICREFVECASERVSVQESCLFPYLVSHFFTFLLDFCGIFGAQVNCLPLPLSLSLFPFLYRFSLSLSLHSSHSHCCAHMPDVDASLAVYPRQKFRIMQSKHLLITFIISTATVAQSRNLTPDPPATPLTTLRKLTLPVALPQPPAESAGGACLPVLLARWYASCTCHTNTSHVVGRKQAAYTHAHRQTHAQTDAK